jgi:DNA-binding response OmpR family regulator
MTKTLLIVEDHAETRAMITAAMEHEGYSILATGTLGEAASLVTKHVPALIILDMVLPDGHGIELCLKVRKDSRLCRIPIIALTGESMLIQKKKGFSCGLDQYLTKPIEMDELAMWVKALLRRVDMERGVQVDSMPLGDVTLIPEAQLIKFKGNCFGDLTKREFELFSALAVRSPKIFSREMIISIVWKTAAVPNLVDTHIFNMRKKLPQELEKRIQSVPGKGFRYLNRNQP